MSELLRRITALEVAVIRLMAEARGRLDSSQKCAVLSVPCVECGEEIEEKDSCNNADCPCGLYVADEEPATRA